jgi:hypothetical protein
VAQVPLKLGYRNRVSAVAQKPRDNGVAMKTARKIKMRTILANFTSDHATILDAREEVSRAVLHLFVLVKTGCDRSSRSKRSRRKELEAVQEFKVHVFKEQKRLFQ